MDFDNSYAYFDWITLEIVDFLTFHLPHGLNET